MIRIAFRMCISLLPCCLSRIFKLKPSPLERYMRGAGKVIKIEGTVSKASNFVVLIDALSA